MKVAENKYTKWYNSIIYRAQQRTVNNVYTENHHILPKCLGGDDSLTNIVTLTGREHFICHVLLTKMLYGGDKAKMINAAIGMKRSRKYQHRYVNARLYETIKKEYAIMSSIRNTGTKMSAETKQKMSLASKGKSKTIEHAKHISEGLTGIVRGPMSDAGKLKRSMTLKGRESPNKGNRYSLTTEQKEKISESNRRRVLSHETKAKIAASLRARKTAQSS